MNYVIRVVASVILPVWSCISGVMLLYCLLRRTDLLNLIVRQVNPNQFFILITRVLMLFSLARSRARLSWD